MSEVIPDVPNFWGLVLNPNEPKEVKIPDLCVLVITNVSLPDSSKSDNPVRVFAEVSTENLDEPGEVSNTKTLIATLIPNQTEQQTVNVLFSPLNKVTLVAKGDAPVHLIGHMTEVNDFGDYAEEEEEEEEEAFEEENVETK